MDGLGALVPAVAPPYLLLEHAGEAFRALLEELGRGAVLGTVAVLASGVNGIISALMAVALEDQRHRRRLLAWTLAALWVTGGGLLVLIYLSPPWQVTAGSLLAGLPRAWLVAWALDRRMGAAGPAARGGPHPA